MYFSFCGIVFKWTEKVEEKIKEHHAIWIKKNTKLTKLKKTDVHTTAPASSNEYMISINHATSLTRDRITHVSLQSGLISPELDKSQKVLDLSHLSPI